MIALAQAGARGQRHRFLVLALALFAPRIARGQDARLWLPADAPRFLMVSPDSTQPPSVIDPSDIPILRRRIAMHLAGASRRDALNAIARASGLQFVYANDVVAPGDSVRLQADDITVMAALTEVLFGAGIDVALGADGNAILVRRAAVVLAPPRRDVVRGRVTTDSGVAIAGADAIVTMAPSAETIRTLTDSSGSYSIAIADGSGEYLLYVGATGRKSFRKRLTRTGGDTTFVVDVTLMSNVATLSAVKVQARRPRPTRSLGSDIAGTDGLDKTVDGVEGALSPDLQGNLAATALLVPGLTVGPNGPTAFGLASGDNKTMLNGLSFGAPDIPRDVVTKSRYTTSAWDPSVGGFSGFQNSITLGRGGNISERSGHFYLDSPALQYADQVASRFGQEPTNLDLGVGASGPIQLEKYYYNYGAQLRRSSYGATSLTDLDPQSLNAAGVSPDSAAKLLQILSALHVPVVAGGIPPERVTTTGSFIGRVDHLTPFVAPGAVPGPSSWLMAYGRYQESDAQGLSPVAPPAYTGRTTRGDFTLQGLYSAFLGSKGDYLNETTSSFSYSETKGTPYLQLPGGNVLIASQLADGSDALGSLAFGGNSALASDARNWQWEVVNQTNFFLGGRETLPFRIYFQSLLEGFRQTVSANRLGSFNYTSLDALESGSPSSFSRTLNQPSPSGGEWIGAGSAGGSWKLGKLTLTGGARVDANVFTAAPDVNPQVESAFGARNDHVPNSVDVSPRLGFVWNPSASGFSSMLADGALLNVGPTQIRGGIGKYRSTLPPTLLAGADQATGLPSGAQSLFCTGPATPIPNWQGYANDPASIPSTCAGSTAFADTARGVQLFARSYSPAESWRAALGITRRILNTYVAVDGTYSINLNQPGTLDLNFGGVPRFTLADENNRPVFVAPASIYPATGGISAVQSRVSPAFGPVLENVSDLRGDSRQVTVYVIPNIPLALGVMTVAYTYSDSRRQERGFDMSTAGDPRVVDWATAIAPHHLIQVGVGHSWRKVLLTTYLRVVSGFPYTPSVAGDINGDGSSNDQAFVFNPATVRDTALASGLRTLLASGPRGAKICLNGQLGEIAARGSCVGPWSASLGAYARFWEALPHTDDRAHVTLSFTNVLGGLDELLHGSAHLQGWGMAAYPDPTLLRVTGFDAAAQQFTYAVNPRFGSTSPANTTLRVPFRMTVGVSVDLGHSYDEQNLDLNLRIRPSLAGTRASPDSIGRRYERFSFTNVYNVLLRMSDSLALSRDQIRAVQEQGALNQARADSIFLVLGNDLAALPNDYDRKDVLRRVKAAGDAGWNVVLDQKPFLLKLLTKGQIRLLPGAILQMLTVANYKGRFFFGGY